MSSTINLVQGENKESLQDKKRVLVLRYISIIFLSFVALLSILLFFLNNRISPEAVKNQENATLQKLSLIKDRSAKLDLLNDRLRNITNILVTRKKYSSTLSSILGQLPAGTAITGFTIDKSGIVMTATSNSLLSLDQFLNNITKIGLTEHILKDVTIEGLSIDKTSGTYSLSLKANSL